MKAFAAAIIRAVFFWLILFPVGLVLALIILCILPLWESKKPWDYYS